MYEILIQGIINSPEMSENSSNALFMDQINFGNETEVSVVELGEQLMTYKAGAFIFKYFVVPIAIWGWTGNFLKFQVISHKIIYSFNDTSVS